MFIGHLPAAYLFACTMSKTVATAQLSFKATVLAALFGGILPDFDLIYFYTIGEKQLVHHQYWSHIPIYWVVIYLCFSLIALLFEKPKIIKILSVAFLAIILHLALDTVTGQIHWLHPFSSSTFTLVNVPAVHGWWMANFILHWTFAVELLLVLLALAVYVKRKVH